jgi:hypothetical protein
MKLVGRFLTLALFLCLLPSLHAADISGTWKGSFYLEGSTVPMTLNLKTADKVVTGTVEVPDAPPAEIHEGKIDGDSVTFWLNTDYEGQTYKVVYKGKISGDTIEFEFGTDDGSWDFTLSAKRDGAQPAAPANVTGS